MTQFSRWAIAAGLLVAAVGAQAQLRTQVVVTGLSLPVAMEQDPTQSNVQFVVQQRGRIRVIVDGVLQGTDFLNLVGIASTSGNERGLLGLAFHPQYAKNRQFYVYYTDLAGTSKIRRFLRSVGNPNQADSGSGSDVLSVSQPFSNHNGGTIRFGPDGYLYIGLGDGGSGNDPGNRAQQITGQLLGKMLRLDVNGDAFPKDPTRNYAIPPTNPFVGPITGDDEIWALGLRNPWKFAFDNPAHLGTGGMLIGDVGQNAWEEIDFEPALAGGRNYGWRPREGFASTGLSGGGNTVPFTDPIFVYPRTVGQSITGGGVYRGTMLGEMFGRYFYADYISGRVFSLKLTYNGAGEATASDNVEHTADLGLSGMNISSLDVDTDGELHLVDYFGGRILKILPENAAWITGVNLELNGPIGGGVRHLLAIDNKVLWLAHQDSAETIEENSASMRVELQTDLGALNNLDFHVNMRMAHPGTGFLKIAFFNWTLNRYIDVGTFTLLTAQTTYTGLNVPAGPYRRADGRIHMNIRPWKEGALQTDPLSHFIDQVKVVPR